jgi:hypothetical protein
MLSEPTVKEKPKITRHISESLEILMKDSLREIMLECDREFIIKNIGKIISQYNKL